jgi:purine-cytosine permease-like protein
MVEIKNRVGDMANAFAGFTAFLGMLSEFLAVIASLMSIAWFGVRFYEYLKNKRDIEKD